jgi:hypothetical protein
MDVKSNKFKDLAAPICVVGNVLNDRLIRSVELVGGTLCSKCDGNINNCVLTAGIHQELELKIL